MVRTLFGTDGIRGVANTYPMTAEVALNVGRAVASLLKRNSHRAKIIIGKVVGAIITIYEKCSRFPKCGIQCFLPMGR